MISVIWRSHSCRTRTLHVLDASPHQSMRSPTGGELRLSTRPPPWPKPATSCAVTVLMPRFSKVGTHAVVASPDPFSLASALFPQRGGELTTIPNLRGVRPARLRSFRPPPHRLRLRVGSVAWNGLGVPRRGEARHPPFGRPLWHDSFRTSMQRSTPKSPAFPVGRKHAVAPHRDHDANFACGVVLLEPHAVQVPRYARPTSP